MAECDYEEGMKAEEYLINNGYYQAEDYYFDKNHHSSAFLKDGMCIILDYDLCRNDDMIPFDYSKYCEMQNHWMAESDTLLRFYVKDGSCDDLITWLDMNPENIEVSDNGGSFDKSHIDNTPLEKSFEDLFTEAYGNVTRKI